MPTILRFDFIIQIINVCLVVSIGTFLRMAGWMDENVIFGLEKKNCNAAEIFGVCLIAMQFPLVLQQWRCGDSATQIECLFAFSSKWNQWWSAYEVTKSPHNLQHNVSNEPRTSDIVNKQTRWYAYRFLLTITCGSYHAVPTKHISRCILACHYDLWHALSKQK